MVECLRKELLYSEKRPRDLLFRAIEELISERPPMMVSQLTREAARLGRNTAEKSGFDFENWDTASKAVMRALLMAEALLTLEGTAIPTGITAQAAVVGGMRDDYCDVTEAFLLEFIIRRLGDVTTRDHTALAHALFRQFDPRVSRDELEDRWSSCSLAWRTTSCCTGTHTASGNATPRSAPPLNAFSALQPLPPSLCHAKHRHIQGGLT